MMRLAPIVLALALTGCAGQSGQLTEGKTLTDAWVALKTAAQVADAAVHTGALHGQNAAKVSADLKVADRALTDATALYQAGSDPTALVISATTAITDIFALTGAK